MKSAHALVRAADFPALADEHAARKDARIDRASAAQRVAELLAIARYAILQHFPLWKVERVMRKFAARTSQHQKVQFKRQVESAIGIPLDTILNQGLSKATDAFVAENVALITSIPQQYFGQVEQVVLGGMKSGMRAQEMGALIEDRFGVAKSRAYLIARDQIGKFTAQLDRQRKLNVGIKREKWHTMEDERVRPTHQELDDVEYDIDDPPEGDDGPAYLDVNCRCWREAVFEGEESGAIQ